MRIVNNGNDYRSPEYVVRSFMDEKSIVFSKEQDARPLSSFGIEVDQPCAESNY